jgi:hypothetical protein
VNEPSIPFTSMVLDLLGESAEHLLPPSTFNCRRVAPQDRGDVDPGLLDVQHAPLWAALAANNPSPGDQMFTAFAPLTDRFSFCAHPQAENFFSEVAAEGNGT